MSKTVVVTGANRGIGLSFCRLYKAQGCTVYAACRNASPELVELVVEAELEAEAKHVEAIYLEAAP